MNSIRSLNSLDEVKSDGKINQLHFNEPNSSLAKVKLNDSEWCLDETVPPQFEEQLGVFKTQIQFEFYTKYVMVGEIIVY